MKLLLCLGFVLVLALPLHAETYSWVDDSGTYNFTEDYSSVPKKFRKKMKRREDVPQDVKQSKVPTPENSVRPVEKNGESVSVVPVEEKDLYGGKSRAVWRKELDVMEAELSAIEQKMQLLRTQIYDPKGISKVQLETLKKEYDESRATYDSTYKSYAQLLETVRKAGIAVEMKK